MASKTNLRANISDLEQRNTALAIARSAMADAVADAVLTLGSIASDLTRVAENDSFLTRLSGADKETVRLSAGRLEDLGRSLSRERDYDSPSPLYTQALSRTGRRALNALVAVQSLVSIGANLPTAVVNADAALVHVVETASRVLLLAPENDVPADTDDATKRTLLNILQSEGGVELWNRLRENPETASELVPGSGLTKGDLNDPDLSGLDLSGLSLSDVNFLRVDLRSAKLAQTNLAGAVLTDSYLTSLDLRSTNLTSTTLVRTQLSGSDLTGLDLSDVLADDANLTDVAATSTRFDGAQLARANFTSASLSGADFSRSNVSDARFASAELDSANFHAATVARASFVGSRLAGATFKEADLSDAAYTDQVDLSGADLRGRTVDRVRFTDFVSSDETLWPDGYPEP